MIVSIITGVFLTIQAGLGLGGEVSAPMTWADAPEAMIEAGYALPGDDNGDGIIDEDESGWECEVMGNRICGPVPECEDWTYVLLDTGSLVHAPRVDPSLPIC
ncbi:hypothetical protein [Rhodococcus phage RGL3]|uniref:Uncharacterized protein n=1 Tax=Rhodococcus phage RGL3 TaxID=2922221 RepID=G9FHQ4_9CAUD|nr:hypothetical protein RoPhRGL3_gp62 [Rhodococcus phage RGL3]AEV52142.1 hypothetical protein [Rhodococcus phage RGL3]